MAFNWTCPFCGNPQTVTNTNYHQGQFPFQTVKSADGFRGIRGLGIVCANPSCLKMSISVEVMGATISHNDVTIYLSKNEPTVLTKDLIPESSAKNLPTFIPAPLREDYLEACRIRDLSPKASATLSRRCLQGMIRDFSGISKSTLFMEIKELKEQVGSGKAPKGVSEESVEAIDDVRKVGNIGAHMEKDINHIVPVDPDEAQILIDLTELLFEEWYIARETRQQRLAKVKALAAEKHAAKKKPAN